MALSSSTCTRTAPCNHAPPNAPSSECASKASHFICASGDLRTSAQKAGGQQNITKTASSMLIELILTVDGTQADHASKVAIPPPPEVGANCEHIDLLRRNPMRLISLPGDGDSHRDESPKDICRPSGNTPLFFLLGTDLWGLGISRECCRPRDPPELILATEYCLRAGGGKEIIARTSGGKLLSVLP